MIIAVTNELRVQLAAHPLAYPVIRALSKIGPVVRVPRLGVVVNDATVARQVLSDPETFGPSMLVNMDGAIRYKLAEFFTPAYVNQLCTDVLSEPLERMASMLLRGVPVDLVYATKVMSGAVISALVGLAAPESTVEREVGYVRLTHQAELITGMVGTLRPRPQQMAQARAIADEVGAAASLAWAAGGRMRQFGLSESEARSLASAFLIAGTETISSLVPRLVALLHDHRVLTAVASAYREGDTGPMDAAIAETSRLITPTPIILRNAVQPGCIGKVQVRTGERVLVSTVNCAKAYGRFDLSMEHPPELRNLWFGAGPHFCLGYPMAMAEIHAILGALFEHAPVKITARKVARGVFCPAYQRLEVTRA